MTITVTVKKRDNSQRGYVSRTIEFEDEVRFNNILGALDGLFRQCFPDDMRRKTLNLSNDTHMQGRPLNVTEFMQAPMPQPRGYGIDPGRGISVAVANNVLEPFSAYTDEVTF